MKHLLPLFSLLFSLSAQEAQLVKPQVDPESVPLEKPLETNVEKVGKPTGDDALRLQIFLDQQNFGPGVIDGKLGLFTEHAVKAWNEVNGHALDDWSEVMKAARSEVAEPVTEVAIPDLTKKWVNPDLPSDRIEQAKLKKTLAYRSVAELMSERYHTDVEYLLTLNGAKKLYNARAGALIKVPNVKPFLIEEIKGTIYKQNPDFENRHVVVDTKRNQLRIFAAAPVALVIEEDENGKEIQTPHRAANRSIIASFPITPGKPKFIHYGMWAVKTQVEFPGWTYDKMLLQQGKRNPDKSQIYELPSGPNSPVGVIWCGLTKSGIGLHGTADPETIGRAQSAGCIRLANWDAIRLPTLISPGTSVEIR